MNEEQEEEEEEAVEEWKKSKRKEGRRQVLVIALSCLTFNFGLDKKKFAIQIEMVLVKRSELN